MMEGENWHLQVVISLALCTLQHNICLAACMCTPEHTHCIGMHTHNTAIVKLNIKNFDFVLCLAAIHLVMC